MGIDLESAFKRPFEELRCLVLIFRPPRSQLSANKKNPNGELEVIIIMLCSVEKEISPEP